MTSRRILFVDQFGALGGGQRVLAGMMRRGAERGWNVAVAAPDGWVREEAARLGVTYFDLRLPVMADGRKGLGDGARFAAGFPRARADVARAVDGHRPDVVHVNGLRVLPHALTVTRSTPLFTHVHSVQIDRATVALSRRTLASPKVRGVLVPSQFMAEWVGLRLGVRYERVSVMENWVDPSFVIGEREPSAPGPLRVVVAGRIIEEKGQLIAVEAVERARDRGADVELTLAGSDAGPYAREVFAAAERLGDAFRYVGKVEDLAPLFRAADVCVVPSVWDEPFGLVAVEAMASGAAVVVSDSGALPEIVSGAGIVVSRGDAGALADGLCRLDGDRRELESLSAAGRRRAAERYAFAVRTDAVFDLFEGAAHGS